MDDAESTLLDLIDNLLSKGVMLNADLILALANVDLVYVRLSALLCAADRVMLPAPDAAKAPGDEPWYVFALVGSRRRRGARAPGCRGPLSMRASPGGLPSSSAAPTCRRRSSGR